MAKPTLPPLVAIIVKELLLLRRDRAGLIVLFIMPAILVVVITLVQENVMELTGQKQVRMLVLDLDRNQFGEQLREQFERLNLDLTTWDEDADREQDAKSAIIRGEYQVGIIIPAEATQHLTEQIKKSIGMNDAADSVPVHLLLHFDPTIMPNLRESITAQLDMAAELLSARLQLDALKQVTLSGFPSAPQALPTTTTSTLVTFTAADSPDSPSQKTHQTYEATQQNVPAWALFGMFFTAIPIAGSILQVRNSGIHARLMSSPISPFSLQLGKIAAYVGVCLCQCLLIYLIGSYLFPVIGLPAFSLGGEPWIAVLIVLCSAMAACGYGVFLGSVCTSYEQASTLGSTSIVAAAAMGGIMVPVYAMPALMQKLSIISPLNWGINAFQELLMRGSPFIVISHDLLRLVLFFIVTSALAGFLSLKSSQ